MKQASPAARQRRVLHPGDCEVTDQAEIMSTLLGSCVAVCMYDPVSGVMGMNHFLLANKRYAQNMPVMQSEAGRYGIHAMELLINGLLSKGAKRQRLKAKAFGGGNVLGRACTSGDNFMCVGAVNVRFVREFLKQDRIPLLAADLGGNFGRQIHFTGEDFSVYLRKIPISQSAHLVEEERVYWRHSLEQHQQQTGIDIW